MPLSALRLIGLMTALFALVTVGAASQQTTARSDKPLPPAEAPGFMSSQADGATKKAIDDVAPPASEEGEGWGGDDAGDVERGAGGACCLPDGTCAVISATFCIAFGGTPYPGQSCSTAPCAEPIGACCLPDGTCLKTVTETDCLNAGGTHFPDLFCSQACLGSCCLADATCIELTLVDCANLTGSTFNFVQGTTCADNNPCNFNACCLPDGTCFDLPADATPAMCEAQGGTFSVGITCEQDACLLAACCLGDGGCAVLIRSQCNALGGIFRPEIAACEASTCVGACCLPEASCDAITIQLCQTLGGRFVFGDPCQFTGAGCGYGACCLHDGTCFRSDEPTCDASGGTFLLGGNCVADACTLYCPPFSENENEPCGDSTNGGCGTNTFMPEFQPLTLGVPMCGRTTARPLPNGAFGRDSDWYILTLDEPTDLQISFTVAPGAPGETVFGIYNSPDPFGRFVGCEQAQGDIVPVGQGSILYPPGGGITATTGCLPAGSYVFVVNAGPLPSSQNCPGSSYTLRIDALDTCTQTMTACCFVDGTCQDLGIIDCIDAGGLYEEGATCATFPCTPNAFCENAIPFTFDPLTGVSITLQGDTSMSSFRTSSYPQLPGGCGTVLMGSRGLWYTFVGAGNRVRVTTCSSVAAFDTQINVYCGACGDLPLTCVAGDDDDNACPFGTTLSTLEFCSIAGRRYYVLVHGFSPTSAGPFEVTITGFEPCSDPVGCPVQNTCLGDFDNDGDVDLGDFGFFGAAFDSVIGDPNYNEAADFDNDGDVDLGDFGAFGMDFTRTDCLQ
ncbi:MAG: hypothetical protein Tsb0013_08530 [Phycisphaerales bacterium]